MTVSIMMCDTLDKLLNIIRVEYLMSNIKNRKKKFMVVKRKVN